MNRLLVLLLSLLASTASAQGVNSPCYWSGTVAKCFPIIGIELDDNRSMRFGESASNGANYVEVIAPASQSGNTVMTLPTTTGTIPSLGSVYAAGAMCYSDSNSLEFNTPGTAQQWALSGGTGAPTFSNTTTTGKIIDGSAAEIQLQVQAHSSQSGNAIFVVEDSAGVDQFAVSAAGNFTAGDVSGGSGGGYVHNIYGALAFTADGGPAPDKGIFEDSSGRLAFRNASRSVMAIDDASALVNIDGATNIIGLADANQLKVRGHTTQTNEVFLVEEGLAATDLFSVSGGGNVIMGYALGANTHTIFGTTRYREDGGGANYAALKAPSLSGDYTLTLPVDDGTANQWLTTDGSGALTWSNTATGDITTAGKVVANGSDLVHVCDNGVNNFATGWNDSSDTATLAMATEHVDRNGNFASNTWTTGKAGYYLITTRGYLIKSSGTMTTGDGLNVSIQKNGSGYGTSINVEGGNLEVNPFAITVAVNAAASDAFIVKAAWNASGGRTYTGSAVFVCMTVTPVP